ADVRPMRRRPAAGAGRALACGQPPAPVVSPAPATRPASPFDTAAAVSQRDESSPAPPLPPAPLVESPLAINVVYPPAQHLIESRDSNFIFGSIGNGRASLTINGAPARVYPNGAFLAFVANPPVAGPRYDLVAVAGNDTARFSHPVRVQDNRPPLAPTGPLVVDTTTISPRAPTTAAMLLRADERVRVTVRAPANASAWVAWPTGSQWLVPAPGDSLAGAAFAADVIARSLRDGAILYVPRATDTLRYGLLRPDLLDTVAIHLVRAGDIPVRPDTDRVLLGRAVPGGTCQWFL